MILITILSLFLSGTTFYVSSSEGNDANSGTSPGQAWQTLEKVSGSFFEPGDRILFRAGDEFIGQLVVNSSGAKEAPIVFGKYEEGPKPIINSAPTPGGSYITSILIRNQSFIELEDLEVTNDRQEMRQGEDQQQGYGIYVHNNGTEVLEHFHFRNLTVRDVYAITTEGVDFDDLQVAGIYFRTERNTDPNNLRQIKNIIVEDCFITRTGKFGIWTQHGGGMQGVGNDMTNRNKDIIFRNNHTYHTGGSGITPGRSYNLLMEGNTFEYPGSGIDPRMTNRGSGAWFFAGRNIIAQFNRVISARGPADTYSIHIDHSNENVFVQFNYSEDSEGGFAEILGDNINSVYRYNVSVNDGFRPNARSMWVSDYAGPNSEIRSDQNYIYNNTIYLSQNRDTGLLFRGHNTYVYNNIVTAAPGSSIGEIEYVVDITEGDDFIVSNNLYNGDIEQDFINTDPNAVTENPLFVNAGGTDSESYILMPDSPAMNAGIVFDQPEFPMAGQGIFADIPAYPEFDLYGNSINWENGSINIGAFAGLLDFENQGIKTGMLQNEDGEPVVNKSVFLFDGGAEIASTKTNVEGQFSLLHDNIDGSLSIVIEESQSHEEKVIGSVPGTGSADLETISLDWLPGEVEDIDGNVYRTLQVGDQIWMAENLRTTRYANGDEIPNVQGNADWGNLSTGAFAVHGNDDLESAKVLDRRLLYNWFAAADERGLCPTDWQVPSDDDIKELEEALGMSSADLDELGGAWRGEDAEVSNAMRSTGGGGDFFWREDNTEEPAATNSSGFSMRGTSVRFPGGAFGQGDGDFSGLGEVGMIWSSTENPENANQAIRRIIRSNQAGVRRNTVGKTAGLAVRCFKEDVGTSIGESGSVGNETPRELSLSQNYPNPFNPITQINFEISQDSLVQLTVYDMLGRRVAVLADEFRAPGSYHVSWDASEFASGVYIYRLEAGGQAIINRMTLLK